MEILDRLAKSKFRSRFKLRAKELEYINEKGLDKIRSHACDFIRDRVAPSEPVNDGKHELSPKKWTINSQVKIFYTQSESFCFYSIVVFHCCSNTCSHQLSIRLVQKFLFLLN